MPKIKFGSHNIILLEEFILSKFKMTEVIDTDQL